MMPTGLLIHFGTGVALMRRLPSRSSILKQVAWCPVDALHAGSFLSHTASLVTDYPEDGGITIAVFKNAGEPGRMCLDVGTKAIPREFWPAFQ